MEKLEIVPRWTWRPNYLECRILEIRGGNMPPNVRSSLQHSNEPDLSTPTNEWQLGNKIVNCLAQRLPPTEAADIGLSTKLQGQIVDICLLDCRESKIIMAYQVGYSPDRLNRMPESHTWLIEDLPELLQQMIKQLSTDVKHRVRVWFYATYGGGEIDPKKWKAEKTKVFISYRGRKVKVAERLFTGLGEYENRTVFLPGIAKVDMQAGNWLDQLMGQIDRCEVFIPLLSRDYLQGPISRPELDQALRQHFNNSTKLIIPVLIEGNTADYQNHFIGGFHMVKALKGVRKSKIKEIAYLALGVSRNPYE